MANITITLAVDDYTAAQLGSKINFDNVRDFRTTFTNFIKGEGAGMQPYTSMQVRNGAVAASGTITFSSTGPAADETVTVNGVVFTGKASGATGNQWNVSTTPSVNATRLAAAINASATAGITGVISASADGAVVTVTCITPGTIGNSLALAESAANTAVSGAALANGSNGTTYSF